MVSKNKVVQIADEHVAHSMLISILTQAAANKKSYKTKFRIPYIELMKGIGHIDTAADADLEVEITCNWVEADYEDDEPIVIEELEDGGEGYE